MIDRYHKQYDKLNRFNLELAYIDNYIKLLESFNEHMSVENEVEEYLYRLSHRCYKAVCERVKA